MILPEAVFLGFINNGSPICSRFLLSELNEVLGIIISPLISNLFGKELFFNLRGMELMVLILLVILSPWEPSPLVRPLTRFPFSYKRFTEAPSYFNSPSKRVGGGLSDKFDSESHTFPMFSLDNTYSDIELEAWYKRIIKIINVEDFEFCCELK